MLDKYNVVIEDEKDLNILPNLSETYIKLLNLNTYREILNAEEANIFKKKEQTIVNKNKKEFSEPIFEKEIFGNIKNSWKKIYYLFKKK